MNMLHVYLAIRGFQTYPLKSHCGFELNPTIYMNIIDAPKL